MLSNASVWFNLILSIITAILPDIVIKVSENLKDAEKIRRIKLRELDSVKNTNSIPNATKNTNINLTQNINSNNNKQAKMKLSEYEEETNLNGRGSPTLVRIFHLPSEDSNSNNQRLYSGTKINKVTLL